MNARSSSLRETRSRRSERNGGFTLVELIVVLVVIGTVSAVSVVSLASLGDTRDASAARRLLHDLSYAREIALSTGSRTWVKFNPGEQTYSLFAETTTTPGRGGSKELYDPATGFAYVQHLNRGEFKGVTMTAVNFDGQLYLGFDWMGAPLASSELSLAAAGTVTLSGGHGVSVEPQSGTITITGGP